tara:strand:+ start:523 stop:1362 length:840 start_codon:yes stop_codon:yes gene_type:complete
MEKKEIKIDPSFFGYGGNSGSKKSSKKEKIKKDMLVNVNGKSVKELLLAKLKDYKKRKTVKNFKPEINKNTQQNQNINPDFIEKIKKRKQKTENSVFTNSNFDNVLPEKNQFTRHVINDLNIHNPKSLQIQSNIIKQAPKYGILKNGNIPTYKSFLQQSHKNRTMKNIVNHCKPQPKEEKIELKIERKLKVGVNKTQKKVGIFIKNGKLRNEIENNKLLLKKTHIKTVKNYLKKNNLIKHGSNAPATLLRNIYENSILIGNVNNNNSKNALHNYMNEEE